MKKNDNGKICFIIVAILSIINLFAKSIGKFIITRNVVYQGLDTMYPDLNFTTRSINFIYLGLILFVVCYFLIYKKEN